MNKLTVLGAAALVAVLSGFGLVRYVGSAEARAQEASEAVSLFVAASAVPEGTVWEDARAQGLVVESRTLRSSLPPTAVTDPGSLSGFVAQDAVLAGQTIVQGVFVPLAEASDRIGPRTFADDLPEGTVAVSFEASGAAAVGNLISPGDRVNLLLNVPNAALLGLPDSGGPAVVHVFQGLEVIAIGTAIRPPEGSETAVANPGASTYTVAVAPRDAARLLYLTRQYEPLLVLVGPGNEPSEQLPVGTLDALPQSLTPVPAPTTTGTGTGTETDADETGAGTDAGADTAAGGEPTTTTAPAG